MTTPTAIGIDIGGTKIAAALIDPDGLRSLVRTIPTSAGEGPQSVVERAIDMAREVRANHSQQPKAVGIGTGGWVEPSTGRIVAATALLPGWAGTPLREAVEDALGLPAVALNDVHAMGIAEARLGAGRGRRVCLSVAVGTGIGGAITLDGRLFEGARSHAGAVGHVNARTGGPECTCGRRGCIEAMSSGPAIARAFGACSGGKTAGPDDRAPSLSDVVAAAIGSEDDLRSCAGHVIRIAGGRLGRVLGGVANVVDPDIVILGGGAAAALGDPFLEAVRAAFSRAVLPMSGAEVVQADLGPSAGVVGAGLVALESVARQAETSR